MSDATEITQLFMHERQGRDRGWFDQMRAAYRPDSIYERATLTPAIPGQSIVVDPEEVAGLRPSYALVALDLKRQGFSIPTDLLGDDRPDEVAAFYQELNSWLVGSEVSG
jgi:hypothetical protein